MLSKSCIFNNVTEAYLESDVQVQNKLNHMDIVILDDSHKDITLLDDILSHSDISYDLDSFTDYNNFMTSISMRFKKPDLLIVDINMSEINGIDVLKKIKHINLFKDIPIIIYSASKSDKDLLNAGKFKADAFFYKPLSIEQFSEFLLNSHLFHK